MTCVLLRSLHIAFSRSGWPFFKQNELFRRADVVCFSSIFELSTSMSSRIMTILEEMSCCEKFTV